MDHNGDGSPAAQKKEDVTNRLLAAFSNLIAQGVLAPGTRLPPERDLAVRFGVSRPSLRHALKALEHMGVLSQRVGDGTYLRESCGEILTRPLELLIVLDNITAGELLDTRLIVEPELAARAAERATSADLETIDQTLLDMRGQRGVRKLTELDIAFHEAIFVASQNRLSQRIFPIIQRAMLTSITMTSKLASANHTLGFHKPIYQAIYRREPEEARQKMMEHLRDSRRLLAKVATRSAAPSIIDSFQPIK